MIGNIDPYAASLWLLRLAFLAAIYLFLAAVARLMWRDLRATSAVRPGELGRLIVVASFDEGPRIGASYALDAVTTIGRDVNNSISYDDPYVSTEHAALTFRGRTWYVEDRGSTNGTYVNGEGVRATTPLGFGDEVQVGQVRFRLDRPRPSRQG